jgi:Cu/Ag efflux protein CusF
MRAAGLLVLSVLSGCGSDPPPPDATYETRGRVTRIAEREGQTHISIHHEEIADFVNREGEAVGMPSMVMEFVVAGDVPLGSLARGDVVDLAFEVRWRGGDMLTITRIGELPVDTPLSLSGPGAR